MLRDILHFNKHGAAAAKPGMTMADLLDDSGHRRLVPRLLHPADLGRDLVDARAQRVLDFPAETLIRFFQNHALMSVTGQHQWYTVQGGSVQYVTRLQQAMMRAGGRYPHGHPHRGGDRRCRAVSWSEPWGPSGRCLTRWSLPPIPTTPCAFWPTLPRPCAPPCPPCVSIQHGHPACRHRPDAQVAQGLGVLGLYRTGGPPARPHRPDLLDELAAADPARTTRCS